MSEITHSEKISEVTEKIPKQITIQTHDKRFHIDDVGAVTILSSYYSKLGYEVQLIRSRDIKLLQKADVVIDVGGVYDPSNLLFDHHQDDCNETFCDSSIIPMSSIGMIWKHYGKSFLSLFLQTSEKNHIDELHKEVYFKIIQELDAHDNGIQATEGGKKNFIAHLHLAHIISSLNTSNTNDDEMQLNAFRNAIELFGKIFEIKLTEVIRKYFDYQESQAVVKKLLETEHEYLILDRKIDTIFKCLNKFDPNYCIKFIICQNSDEQEITVRTRASKENQYQPLVPLLMTNDEEIIFIHKNLFLAKTKTIEAAIKLVNDSLSVNKLLEKDVLTDNESSSRDFPVSRVSEIPRKWLAIGGLTGIVIGAIGGTLLFNKD